MPSSLSDFDIITSPKAISALTYTLVVTLTLFSDTQIQNIRKVYNEKMVLLDKQLSQEVKQHQAETRQMKYVIIQLVKQKEDLEKKLKTKTTVTTSTTKTPVPTFTTKIPASTPTKTLKPLPPSSLNLKKPNPPNPKSNVKFIDNTPKKALILKTPTYIKYNQI
jgi:hypothetical protein